MNYHQLNHFKSLLLEQLQEMQQNLNHQKQEELDFKLIEPGDHTDHATNLNNEVLQTLAQSELNLIKKIEIALQRIEQGVYGSCISCGENISISRLEAKPCVSLCIKCQSNKEHLSLNKD